MNKIPAALITLSTLIGASAFAGQTIGCSINQRLDDAASQRFAVSQIELKGAGRVSSEQDLRQVEASITLVSGEKLKKGSVSSGPRQTVVISAENSARRLQVVLPFSLLGKDFSSRTLAVSIANPYSDSDIWPMRLTATCQGLQR